MDPIIRRNAYLLLGFQIVALLLLLATQESFYGYVALVPWAAIYLRLNKEL